MSERMIPVSAVQALSDELWTMVRVAGQASVDSQDSIRAQADAQFAGYCAKWAGTLDALIATAQQNAASESQVGCEGQDGLLRVHSAAETCDVCKPLPDAAASAREQEIRARWQRVNERHDPDSELHHTSRDVLFVLDHLRALRESTDLLRSQLATALERERKAQEERDAFRDEANAIRRNYLTETTDLAKRADKAESRLSSLREAMTVLVTEYNRWKNTTDIQNQGSMEWWVKDEIAEAERLLRDSEEGERR